MQGNIDVSIHQMFIVPDVRVLPLPTLFAFHTDVAIYLPCFLDGL